MILVWKLSQDLCQILSWLLPATLRDLRFIWLFLLHILFCGRRDASWFLQTWIHVLFFVLDVWPTSSSPPWSNHKSNILLLLISNSGKQFWCWQVTLWKQYFLSLSVWAGESHQIPFSQSYNTLNKRIASLIIQQSALVPYSAPFLPRDLCYGDTASPCPPPLIQLFISWCNIYKIKCQWLLI